MIGVFDSGFGGLTILRGLVKELPQYDYFYLGDNVHVPYGSRSQEVILKFTKDAVNYLFKQGCILIILACNTASAEALRCIQQEYLLSHYPNRRILGIIRPTAETAIEKFKNKNNLKIGIIATESTVRSKSFIKEIKKLKPETKIFQQACPLLVPIIEAGEQNSKGAILILKKYLKSLLDKKINILILGCTHYPVIKNKIRKFIDPKISIISEDEILPAKLKNYLIRHPEIEKQLTKKGNRIFMTTDLAVNFKKLSSLFFGKQIEPKLINFHE